MAKMTDAEKSAWAKTGNIVTNKCDNPACEKPITFLTYRGKQGEYCSNACLETCEVPPVSNKRKKEGATVKSSSKSTPEEATGDNQTPESGEQSAIEEQDMSKAGAAAAAAKPKKKTAKKTTKAAPPKKAAKKTAKAAPAVESTEKVAGRYRSGSVQAIYAERLSDEKPHKLSELSDGIDTDYPRDGVWYLKKHGAEDGTWSITEDRTDKTDPSFTMKLTAKGRKAFGK